MWSPYTLVEVMVALSLLYKVYCPCVVTLTVASCCDEDSSSKEHGEEHVTAEEKPPQNRQVVEPGGRVSVQSLVEKCLKVGLALKCPNCP